MWTFERVIVDYLNDKAYFIKRNDHPESYSLKDFNRANILHPAKEIKLEAKPGGREVRMAKDGIEKRLVFYGKMTIFKNSAGSDSIFYQDSLLLATGKMKYGPSIFKFDELK